MPHITVIYGPQGSGKTTRARAIADQYLPNEAIFSTFTMLEKMEYEISPLSKIVVIDETPENVPVEYVESLKFWAAGDNGIFPDEVFPEKIVLVVQTNRVTYQNSGILKNAEFISTHPA